MVRTRISAASVRQLHITDNFTLIDAQQSNVGVPAQLTAAAFRRLPVQLFEQRRRGTKQHGMTGEHGGVSDVLSDHRLAQTVATHQDEIAGFAEKVPGICPQEIR